jgi:hypothetical protein
MPSTALNSFTQHEILRQIGRQRLGKLFAPFEQELKAHNLVLPKPVPGSDDYFYELANVFTHPESLPENLRKTLFALEEAASPENDERLWTAIKRRIPCVSVSIDCPLDLTLELWFQAPDEFPALHSFSAGGPVQPPLHTDAHELAANSRRLPSPIRWERDQG